MKNFKSPLAVVLSAGLILMGTPGVSPAAMIGTERLAAQSQRADTEARLQNLLSREDVQQQLTAWGVDPVQAKSRAAAMSDEEIQRVAATLDQQPAGGDVFGLIGVVFVVLLILELVGVTNIFSRI
ncbi:hypothetical protein ED208_14300 [Stagnimonas aquatica]|uniref:PA2779 family protein n=1 Tax=Stagnimonas aquatica TaxID=2689987 RepID=A0A3N0V4Z2_9GAMM|nr:PA2779 family protein [Stagnimonas aquatica]ROH87877.1 hypothetical protein ED208_14300 [Stagnimonas aquatica]